MWLMGQAPAGTFQEIMQLDPPTASPGRIAKVEGALRPYLPALAVANPGSDEMLKVGAHPDYWIALFRRPMLSDHVGPAYPPAVAAEIKAILTRLDPNQRC